MFFVIITSLANSALLRDYSSQNLAASVGVNQSSIVKFSLMTGSPFRGTGKLLMRSNGVV